jgi:hypothetical protein
VAVAGPAFEGAEGMFDNFGPAAHLSVGIFHPRTMPLEDGFVLPAVDGAPWCLEGEAARAQRTAVAIGLAADIADLEPAAVGLAAVHRAQLLAIMTAGAYGAVQSGFYNTRPLVPEVLVKDDQYAVVRPRIEVDELIAMDRQAPWL